MIPKMIRIPTQYDYKDIYFRIRNFTEMLGWQGFSLRYYNYCAMVGCLAWVLRDKDIANNLGIDLNKGLLIMGAPNSGKTLFMDLLSRIVIPITEDPRPFQLHFCTMISDQYSQEGRKVLDPYSYRHPPVGFCFDGLGKELATSYYSASFEVMNKLIIDRADCYTLSGTITHLTTHLTGNQIENRYGSEVRGKMKFMFNQIPLENEKRVAS